MQSNPNPNPNPNPNSSPNPNPYPNPNQVSYFAIVKKNLQDSVPKAIMHFLVNQCKAGFQNELVAELYRENEFEQMLCEAPEAVRRRTECHEVVRALERAMELLGELRDVRL